MKKHPCQTRQIYFHVRFQLRNLKTPDENPPKNCLCRYRTKSANRAMFATDKAVSWFNLSRFSQNSHHFNGFFPFILHFQTALYAEAA